MKYSDEEKPNKEDGKRGKVEESDSEQYNDVYIRLGLRSLSLKDLQVEIFNPMTKDCEYWIKRFNLA
ncbi:hypothetical protein J6590_087337, partial [Homalodisca vitripennis]